MLKTNFKTLTNWPNVLSEIQGIFCHFILLFCLTSPTTQTQETVITIDHIICGDMMSTFLQRFKDDVLLTARDEKRLLMESQQHSGESPTFY